MIQCQCCGWPHTVNAPFPSSPDRARFCTKDCFEDYCAGRRVPRVHQVPVEVLRLYGLPPFAFPGKPHRRVSL